MEDIYRHLSLSAEKVVMKAMPPDRPNIFIDVIHQPNYDVERDLMWLVDDLATLQSSQPKTLIFAYGINKVTEIYEFFMHTLGTKAYKTDVGVPTDRDRLISIFHGNIGDTLHAFTLEEFKKPKSKIRVLVSTVAFGMGIEIGDIRQVIHWGRNKSVMSYWQEVGRCGRDGSKSKAIWYPQSTVGDDKELFDSIKCDTSSCIRLTILEAFHLPAMDAALLQVMRNKAPCDQPVKCSDCVCAACECCSHCRLQCRCR